MREPAPLTDLIQLARAGDEVALGRVFEITYPELRALARSRLSRGGRHTVLDTTALVHESFMRFAAARQLQIDDRQHFMRYAAHVMRSVVVDYVRERQSQRRGGEVLQVTLNTDAVEEGVLGEAEILGVHDALEDLARVDPRLVQIVEMRYFGGLTEPEIATALDISERTVRREWSKARLLLATALS